MSQIGTGGVPEWLKGTGCKPVGYAYVGSNPTPSTIALGHRFGTGCRRAAGLVRGCSSMVELQPSKLATWVRFPSPAPSAPPGHTDELKFGRFF
ncbi:protein of unknown function [Magnetospira sp. QH-2]|nr:protein of unknown function [Magnetospira sp. QH-2]